MGSGEKTKKNLTDEIRGDAVNSYIQVSQNDRKLGHLLRSVYKIRFI